MVTRELIYQFRDRIVNGFDPEKIILFGSHAYGELSIDSDVDVLVILSFEGKSARKSAEILVQTDPHFPTDLIVRTPEQVRDRVAKGDFFLKEILERGEVLYERTHS